MVLRQAQGPRDVDQGPRGVAQGPRSVAQGPRDVNQGPNNNYRSKTFRPLRKSPLTFPVSSRPSKGVALPFEQKSLESTIQSSSGSTSARSAE